MAVHNELPPGVHGICMNRIKPVAQEYASGRSHSIVAFAGHLTGGGWLREILKDFASEEGLTFDHGRPENIDCSTDIFMVKFAGMR